MKTLALGDTHGRKTWKDIVNKEQPDKIIFIGDYFDSFDISGEDQINNFKDIIEFKTAFGNDCILLIGNHDFHYLVDGERYSGFQNGYQYTISHLLKTNLHLMQMCHIDGIFCFTHAGVSNRWCLNTGIDLENLEQSINDTWTYKPDSFRFYGKDPYGDDITQSPIWIRPNSLSSNSLIEYTHVVGHTVQPTINQYNNIIFIDSIMNDEYLIIDTDSDKKYTVGKL